MNNDEIKQQLIINEYLLAKDLILKRRDGTWHKLTYLVTYNLAYFGAVFYLLEQASLCELQKSIYIVFASVVVFCANLAFLMIYLREHCEEKENWQCIKQIRYNYFEKKTDPFQLKDIEKGRPYPTHSFFWFLLIFLVFVFCPVLIFCYAICLACANVYISFTILIIILTSLFILAVRKECFSIVKTHGKYLAIFQTNGGGK